MEKKRIVIIDDEQDLLDLLQLILEFEGFKVLPVLSKDAFEIIKNLYKTPDLFLSSLAMDDVSGLEVLEWLKKQDKFKDIPFVFMTANLTLKNIIQKEGKIDYDDIITKPFSIKDLSIRLKKFL